MRRALMVFVLILLAPVLAGADLTIKEETFIEGLMGIMASKGSEITYLEGDKYRNESEVERGPMMRPAPIKDPPPRVTIIRLDKGLMYRVNLKDETYQEVELQAMEEEREARHSYKIADLDVEPTGETREIVGRPCQGIKATVTFEVDSGEEVVDQTVDMLLWMTEETEGLEEMRTFWEESLKLSQGEDQKVPVWESLQKMWEQAEEFKGIPLAADITIELNLSEAQKAQMKQAQQMLKAETDEGSEPGEEPETNIRIVREVVSISMDEIDDSVFEVPEGFKKADRIRIW
jgi:hypothetical protein